MPRFLALRTLARWTATPLCAALMLAPASAQQAPAEDEIKQEEIYQILVACAAYTTVAAQMAGEEDTGPNRDLSARFTRASVMVEPTQNAANVDDAISGTVGGLLISRMDASKKAETDASFAALDSNCKQIDTNIISPMLAEMDAKAK